MNYILSDADQIIDPVIHDGLFKSIVIVDENNILLGFELINKDLITCNLKNISVLRVNEFLNGNIILDITITNVAEAPINDVMYAYSVKDENYIKSKIKELADMNYLVFCLNPSFGASLVCICKDVEFKKEGLFNEQA